MQKTIMVGYGGVQSSGHHLIIMIKMFCAGDDTWEVFEEKKPFVFFIKNTIMSPYCLDLKKLKKCF